MKNIRGRSLVTVMVIVAVCALSLRIIIAQAIRLNISQNESSAQAAIKLISAALENYAKDKQAFPESFLALIETDPPYLDIDYVTQSPIRGYNYNCLRLEPSGYSCSAVPVKCNLSGKNIYTVTTAGALASEDCNKNE